MASRVNRYFSNFFSANELDSAGDIETGSSQYHTVLNSINGYLRRSYSTLTDIVSRLDNILSNSQGNSVLFTDVKNLLIDIKLYVNDIHINFNNLYNKLTPMLDKYYNLLFSINGSLNDLLTNYYIPEWSGDLKFGWESFWSTFETKSFDVVLKDVLLDVQKEIDNQVNPLSDDNKEQFNANIDKLKSDTAYGSALELKDGVQTFYNNFASASPIATLDVKLLPVSFYSAFIPAKTITIDFSWFAPYRDTTLSLWRFFLWVGYLFIIFKRFPDIISGAGMITDTTTNGNMTDGAESILHSITVNDDGSVVSDIESRTVKQGNTTNRVTVKHDVSGKSTDLRR